MSRPRRSDRLETNIRPPLATARHSAVVVQETPRRSGERASRADCHCPDVGAVVVKTLPAAAPFSPETATHRVAEGHDTAVRCGAPGP